MMRDILSNFSFLFYFILFYFILYFFFCCLFYVDSMKYLYMNFIINIVIHDKEIRKRKIRIVNIPKEEVAFITYAVIASFKN